jgi:hypothetical protein
MSLTLYKLALFILFNKKIYLNQCTRHSNGHGSSHLVSFSTCQSIYSVIPDAYPSSSSSLYCLFFLSAMGISKWKIHVTMHKSTLIAEGWKKVMGTAA